MKVRGLDGDWAGVLTGLGRDWDRVGLWGMGDVGCVAGGGGGGLRWI